MECFLLYLTVCCTLCVCVIYIYIYIYIYICREREREGHIVSHQHPSRHLIKRIIVLLLLTRTGWMIDF